MKYLFIIILMYHSSSFAQNNPITVSPSKQFPDYIKKTYTLSQNSVDASLDLLIYSKTVIKYSLLIKSPFKRIEQNGYALNLADPDLEGGFEYESDEKGNELGVIPYQSWHCDCNDKFNIEIRIALDGSKVSIFSSQKLRSELLNEKITDTEHLNQTVPLLSYLYPKSEN